MFFFLSDTLDLNITGKKHNVGVTKKGSVHKSEIFPVTVYIFDIFMTDRIHLKLDV